jgi:hypothetical protein
MMAAAECKIDPIRRKKYIQQGWHCAWITGKVCNLQNKLLR